MSPAQFGISGLSQANSGPVNLNHPARDIFTPFGGYKQPGNGREYAGLGIHDFCKVKGIVGYTR